MIAVPISVKAEIGRRDDPQFAARLVVEFAGGSFGVVKLGKNATALLIKGAPGIGNADPACGAIEKTCAETFLELPHMLAGCGAREAKPLGRSS